MAVEKSNQSSLFLLGIVGIVGIVAIVVLMSGGQRSVLQSSGAYSESNVAGQASSGLARISCMTKQQVESNTKLCLFIYRNTVFIKGNYPNSHHGIPCGSDVTNRMIGSHQNNPEMYLYPYFYKPLCKPIRIEN